MTGDSDVPLDVSRRALLTTGVATAGVLTLGVGGIGAEGTGTDGQYADVTSHNRPRAATARTDEQREFTARLAPENAVPGEDGYEPYDDPAARGEATFRLGDDGNELSWTVELSNIECVTGGHVHRGGPDENGPHLAELFNLSEPTGEVDGVFREGTFGEGDSCGEDENNCLPHGVTFDDLLDEMRSGNTYMQVHATRDRAIRGQIE